MFLVNSLFNELNALFSLAFEQAGLPAELGKVTLSDRPDLGQFQCNGALPGAKVLQQNPRAIAQKIVDQLENDPRIQTLSIAGPGFINIVLSSDYLCESFGQMIQDARLKGPLLESPLKAVLDYGGPNVAKPLHVGHLRSAIIGDSINRLLKFLGFETLSDVHLGDWGLQMGMLIEGLKEAQPDLPYFDPNFTGPYPKESPVTLEDLQVLYPQASKACKSSEEKMAKARQATTELQSKHPGYYALWQHFVAVTIADLKQDYGILGVNFDLWNGESAYDDRMPAMIEKIQASGVVVKSEGALTIPVAQEEDKTQIPPLLLLKSDGGTLYATTDLASIEERVEDLQADYSYYIVDKRQSLHFDQVFRAAKKSGLSKEMQMEHIPFGTMNGMDGKPFATRAGGIMQLKDLIQMIVTKAVEKIAESGLAKAYSEEEKALIAKQVGVASLRFADLSNYRGADYKFDPEAFSKFEGKTGPYILYTTVRLKSISEKAKEQGFAEGPLTGELSDVETPLVLQLLGMPEVCLRAFAEKAPHHIAEYAFELAQKSSRFYNECHILKATDESQRAAWLTLANACVRMLEQMLDLLGIQVPAKM